jgi:hypothetical protein
MSVRGLSFSLSGKDGDSNRLQPAGQNPYHTPIRVCTSLAWVTIHPIRKWVWIEPQGLGDGWCQVAQIMPAHGQSQVAQVMPAHGQPRPFALFLASPRCVPQSKLTSNGVLGFTVRTSYPVVMCKVRSISTKGQITKRSLTDTDGIKEHRSTRPQQQHSNTGSCPVSHYSLSHGSFSR